MTKTLTLQFKTTKGKNFRLSFKQPKEGLTKADVEPIATKIIESKIFNKTGRELASFTKVSYVSRDEAVVQ